MQNEIVTQSHILTPGVEQSFGILTTPHELAEIIVNANGAVEANHSEWRLYDVSPAGAALIWRGALTPPFEAAQRLVTGIAAGSLIELRAILDPSIVVASAVAVTASLIGYDPDCCTGDTGSETGGSGDAVLVWGRKVALEGPGDTFFTQGFDTGAAFYDEIINVPMPRDGTLSRIYVQQTPGVGTASVVYTLMVNGVATATEVTLGNTDTDGSNIVDLSPLFAGDLLGLRARISGESFVSGPSDVTISVVFD
jgi:hypothetical protein